VVAGVNVPSFTPEPETLRAVDAIIARSPFTHVVATSESHIELAGLLRSRYGLEGMGYEQALLVTNKWRMKQAVRGHWPAARAWLSGEFVARDGPRPATVVVKPLASSAARGVRRLALADALALLAAGDELLLVEEYLDAVEELHCDGLVRGGRLEWAVVSVYDRPVLVSNGSTAASVHLTPADPRVAPARAAAERVLGALAVTDAVFHLELLQVGETLYFGEIGLRPAGGGIAESIARSFGADLWLEFVGLQAGITERLSPLPRRRDDHCGVIGVVAAGERPDNSCEFSRLQFFEGLADADVAPLLREVAA
jgi:hypothetical protein